jgi:hypothetical protein
MRSPNVLGSAAALQRLTLHVAACALLLAAASEAVAGACGDSVDGARVPCSCGDNVVSDTVLWASDPVATETCSGDGLVVVADHDAQGITLNLGGQSLTGRGHGSGIRVVRGGSLGAVIVGGDEGDARAEIANFGTGIRATGGDVLREIRAIDIHGNEADGLFVRASGVKVEDVRSEGNGRNGLAISGHGNEVSGVTARSNARDGVKVRGSNSTVEATTTGNARNGAAVGGRGNRVDKLHAGDNGGAAVMATGNDHEVGELSATGNAGGNVAGRAGAARSAGAPR